MATKLKISGKLHQKLKSHLLPGDGLEASAVGVCGRYSHQGNLYFLVHDIFLIPHDECIRESQYIQWKTEITIPMVERAANENLAFIKFHSHPGGYNEFSELDDSADKLLFKSIYGWTEGEEWHCSAVMLPDGSMFGRCIDPAINFHPFDVIHLTGSKIRFWYKSPEVYKKSEAMLRNVEAFGQDFGALARTLTIGIVGCSGTGSPVAECLARLGVGRILLFDPQIVEEKNLNRILNSTISDVHKQRFKVEVLKKAIEKIGFGTEVDANPENIYSETAIKKLAGCDIIFGCVDSAEGRYLLNKMCSFYLIPYFDLAVGIRIKNEEISHINAVVRYLQPDGANLLSLKVFTMKEVEAESYKRMNSDATDEELKQRYISNSDVSNPGVLPVNMLTASLAVMECKARLADYRVPLDKNFETAFFNLTEMDIVYFAEAEPNARQIKNTGLGDVSPLLNMPFFG